MWVRAAPLARAPPPLSASDPAPLVLSWSRVTLVRLFVYGTLRHGEANHRELGAARFVGSASTEPRYAVVERDGYPALVPGTRAVTGELFEVAEAELSRLDAFEGSGYVRELVQLAGGSTAYAYFSAGGA